MFLNLNDCNGEEVVINMEYVTGFREKKDENGEMCTIISMGLGKICVKQGYEELKLIMCGLGDAYSYNLEQAKLVSKSLEAKDE